VVSTPLKNMKVSWDDYSQCMEKCGKIKNVPNHPPDIVVFNQLSYCLGSPPVK
jgi:hypothetical protein